tara:strand:+ start:1314 stop:2039 length:726 start_codon:yes stop_codon:yes gene_type:complete
MCERHDSILPETMFSRRTLLKAGAFAAFTPWSFTHSIAAESTAAANAITPADALQRLMAGNARYAANTPNNRDFMADRAARAKSQFPIAAILSCADSRVAPELAFDQNPGDLFVMRVAGNVMSPHLLASLEYGVKFLGTPLVMVLGHINCGAVSAAISVLKDKAELPGHLSGLIEAIKPAVVQAKASQPKNLLNSAITENVRLQVADLKQSSPIIDKFYADKKIDIVGAIYDLETGNIALV